MLYGPRKPVHGNVPPVFESVYHKSYTREFFVLVYWIFDYQIVYSQSHAFSREV